MSGEDIVAVTMIGDLTSGTSTEQRRRGRTEQQSHILNSAGAILWRADAVTFQFLYVSEEAQRLLGYPCRQWLEEPGFWKEHIHPDDRAETAAVCAAQVALMKPHTLEYRMISADGRTVWIKDQVRVVAGEGRPQELIGVMVDVTARKAAEQELQENVTRFREIAEMTREVFWVTDPAKTRMLYISPAYEEIWGRTRASLYANPMSFVEAIHAGDREGVSSRMAGQARGEYDEVYRIVRPDGSLRWIHDRAFPVHSPAGELLRIVGSAQDITELKRTEQALRESEGRYRNLFESAPDGILVADARGRYVDVNPAALGMLGYAHDELIGMTGGDILAPEEASRVDAALAEINQGIAHRHEWRFRRKDGSMFDADVLATVMADGRILALIRDVSDRRRLEDQLLQSQKMEAVGRLAGGVAHDFNNSLGVILGYTELLMRNAGNGQRGKLEQILKATKRASALTRQLLAFSRKQIVHPKVLDINALLSDLEQMIGPLIGEDIDLAIVPGADLGQVKADPGQLEQVVMNLCVNARDAMPDGGLLRIETSNAEVAAGQATRNEPMAAGRYVMLAVSDTGCGIAEELLPKIFEPFFTTKEEGKGTGLGLAMVYGTVKQAGGYVWVYSEVGRGTTFQVYLPRIDEPAEAPMVQARPMPAKGWETILLVEDENSLRDMAREILQEQGYRVIDAGGPEEAVEIARLAPEPIHLLVTDVVMPGMNGRTLAQKLLAARPELRVLYMSGYTDDVIAHSGVLESGTLLIEKPFAGLALAERVREALAKSPP
jgi:PAS domain S-box-containing protein